TGLVHTIGLYLAGDGTRIGPSGAPDPARAQDVERRLAAPGSQYAGSPELLCSLRQNGVTEPVTDQPTEPATDQPTEPATGQPTGQVADQSTDHATDQAADSS